MMMMLHTGIRQTFGDLSGDCGTGEEGSTSPQYVNSIALKKVS